MDNSCGIAPKVDLWLLHVLADTYAFIHIQTYLKIHLPHIHIHIKVGGS